MLHYTINRIFALEAPVSVLIRVFTEQLVITNFAAPYLCNVRWRALLTLPAIYNKTV